MAHDQGEKGVGEVPPIPVRVQKRPKDAPPTYIDGVKLSDLEFRQRESSCSDDPFIRVRLAG